VSIRKNKLEAERAAHQSVQKHVEALPSPGIEPPLSDDILKIAMKSYERGYCPNGELFSAQRRIEDVVRAASSDILLVSGKGKSLSRRVNGRALLVLLPVASPFRAKQFFIGTYTFAFGFWRTRFLFLSTIEPGGVATHLHQRIKQRSAAAFANMAEAQDRFSDLWPMLFELGTRRRTAGKRGNVGDFVSPWADGLMFGDFARVDFEAETLALKAPRLLDFDPARGALWKHEVIDWYRSGPERLGYNLRTYIGPTDLKAHQAELYRRLAEFCAKYGRAINHFKNVGRLAVGHSRGAGEALAEMLGMPTPKLEEIDEALAALDQLSSSDLWLAEVAKSRENRQRAAASKGEKA
jgi:hypothetical protein